MSLLDKILGLIIAYLLGSIPFGYLLVKYVFTRGQDIRQVGSGNIGATNVGRVAGTKGAVLTYVLDVGKGALAVFIAGWVSHYDVWWMGAAGLLAIVGHLFPIWIGFRGGKGVATGVGVYIVLSPYATLSSLLVWVVIVYWKRYVSLASILATAALPLWILLWDGKIFPKPTHQLLGMLILSILAGALIVAKHHDNIRRLLKGEEHKIGSRRGQPVGSEV